MADTLKQNLVIPEVLSDLVESHLGQKSPLLALALTDDSLEGRPGDTLRFPAFRYIGKAEAIDENGQVSPGLLSADTVQVTVKKYAKAVRITDEARLSGFGDPLGEAAKQLAHSIDHAINDALYEQLWQAGYERRYMADSLSSEAVAGALMLFGEEPEGEKVLLTNAEGFAQLRLDPGYIRACDLGQELVLSGAVGSIWGCQILVSERLKPHETHQELCAFILKPGALKLVLKAGTLVEVEREPEYMRDTIYASKHCAAYLFDAGKAILLSRPTGLEPLPQSAGFKSLAGGPGKTRLFIPEGYQAPKGCQWLYTLDDDPANKGVFGTAFTGTPWVSNETAFPTGGKMFLHAVLVKAQGKLPFKTLTLPVNAG